MSTSFANPIAFLILAAFALNFFWKRQRRTKPILFPSFFHLAPPQQTWRERLRIPVLLGLGLLSLVCLAIAAARPQRISVLDDQAQARNLILSLDLSKSMLTRDFMVGSTRISRIQGVKAVVRDFLEKRLDDRLGIVVFGSQAFLQAPLTRDHALLEQLVGALEVGLAGDGTAIGDGLGLAIKRIRDLPAASRAIILLTDGVSNAGQINPIQAAKVARDLGVRVYTIGIGSNESVSESIGGFIPRTIQRPAEFDEKTLRQIAELTQAKYFSASDADALERVYSEIDQLELSAKVEHHKLHVEELFAPWALLGSITLLIVFLLGRTVFLKVPI